MRRTLLALALLAAPRASQAWNFDWSGAVEDAAKDLQDADPKKRLDAIGQLATHDIALTQPYLMRELNDDDDAVKQAAAKALGAGGALAAVPVMIEWLGSPDIKTKKVAAEVLGNIGGPDATAQLSRSLGDTDPQVRQQCVRALGEIGRHGNLNVVISLIPRLEDEKADVRRETIDRLEELGDHRAVIPLVARFGDSSRDVRKAAVHAVGKIGDKSAVPALIRLVNDADEDVRLAAVGSLGNLGAVDAIDALTEQLANGNGEFKGKVAYALGQIAASPGAGKAGEDAMRTLVENLYYAPLRAASREALKVAGKAAVPALVAHLQGRLKGDPTSAVTLLVEAGDPRATAALAAELERGRVATPLVLKALGATGDPAALVPVLGALSHKDAAIRLAAMEALEPLIGRDARAGDVLIEHLTDEDLEVRILAAEYLGRLHVVAANAKLVALAGAGNPTRLRLAAIDALGLGGRPDATAALLAVLREGPTELHRAAATALSYIADPAALPPLIALAKTDRGPTRHEVVRALGATLRGKADPAAREAARKTLRELAQDSNLKVAVAAIAGLAAASDPGDVEFLEQLVAQGAADRQRAAAWALGEMHATDSINTLRLATASKDGKDDRLVGDAAWALGEIAASTPADKRLGAVVDRWLYLAQHGAWAGAIDSTGALARLLWATPAPARAQLLAGERRVTLGKLASNKSRLVRLNVATALGALTGDDAAIKTLAQLAHDDASPHVRAAAVLGLVRAGAGKDAAAVAIAAALGDADASVREAAQAKPAPPPPRVEWRSFYVVDPSADDAPVRQEQYFIHGADGVVWASYTDARGELTSEHVAAGDPLVWAASREPEY